MGTFMSDTNTLTQSPAPYTAPSAEALARFGASKSVTVLGATGSVGQSTLGLIADARARAAGDGGDAVYPIEALTAGSNVEELARLARAFGPRFVAVADASKGDALRDALADLPIETAAGPEAVLAAAQRPSDWVMAAIVGAAGLPPTLEAARRGAVIAFANKEALVCAGSLLTRLVAEGGGALLPVDSEHNAIFQVLEPRNRDHIEKLILTASGGPFRDWTREAMAAVTPEQAVKHPNWSMGAKISVDSATMMNKGLELIEAHHLFDMEPERLDVVVHPQSVIHSLVAYADGSVLTQMGTPDMTIPIASALAWPHRMVTPAARLDLAAVSPLTFEPPDETRFPCLRVARAAMEAGGAAAAAVNAANEVAVARFLDRRLGFLDIHRVTADALDAYLAADASGRESTLDDVMAVDRAARGRAAEIADAVRA